MRRDVFDVHRVMQNLFFTEKQSEYGTPIVTLSDSRTMQLLDLYSRIFF